MKKQRVAFALMMASATVLQIACAELCAEESPPTSKGQPSELSSSSAVKSPSIEFIRPKTNDHVSDYPIFIETRVQNCKLEAPVQYWSVVRVSESRRGHIHYTLDNSPIFATKSTKVVMAKPGNKSLPVGKHILRAELVYINHENRKPRVFAEIPIWCERAPQKPSTTDGVMQMDDRTRKELQAVEQELSAIQKELTQLKDHAVEVPNP